MAKKKKLQVSFLKHGLAGNVASMAGSEEMLETEAMSLCVRNTGDCGGLDSLAEGLVSTPRFFILVSTQPEWPLPLVAACHPVL